MLHEQREKVSVFCRRAPGALSSIHNETKTQQQQRKDSLLCQFNNMQKLSTTTTKQPLLPPQDHRVLLKQQQQQQRAATASPPPSPRLQRPEFAAALMRTPARWTPDDGEHEVLLVEYGGGHKYAPGRLELFAAARRANEDMRTAVMRELWRYTDLHFLDMPRLDSALRAAVGAPPAHLDAAVYHMLVQREASEGMVDRLHAGASRGIETLDDPAAPLGGPGFRLVWCRLSALRVMQCNLRRNMLVRNRRRYFGPLLDWYVEVNCARGLCAAHFAKKLSLGVYRVHPMPADDEAAAAAAPLAGPRRHSVEDFTSDLPASFLEGASASPKAAAAATAAPTAVASPPSPPPPAPGSFPPFMALLTSTTRAAAGPFCWGHWHLALRQTLMGVSGHLHLDLVHVEPTDAAEALQRIAAADKASSWRRYPSMHRRCATAAVRRLFGGAQCEAETCTGVLLPDAGLAAAAVGDAPTPAVAGAFRELDDDEDAEREEDTAATTTANKGTTAVAHVAVDFAAAAALLGLREDAAADLVESASGLRWWSMGTLRHLLNLRRKFERLLTGMTRGAAMAHMSAARQFKGRSVDAYTFSPVLAAYLDWAQRAVARNSPVWARRTFAAVHPPPPPAQTLPAALTAAAAATTAEEESEAESEEEEEISPPPPLAPASPPQMHDERAFPALPSRRRPVVVEEAAEEDIQPPVRARGPPAAPEGPVLRAVLASPTEVATLPVAVAVPAVAASCPAAAATTPAVAITAAVDVVTGVTGTTDFEFDLQRFAEQLAQDHAAARKREHEQTEAFLMSLRRRPPLSAFDRVIAPPGLRRRPATPPPPPPPSTWASLAALTATCISEPGALQDILLLSSIEDNHMMMSR